MKVELIYAQPDEQHILSIEVDEGTTVEKAIKQSGILEKYPELALSDLEVGIFSQAVDLAHVLSAGDRIEIYRSLTIDPKEARRIRARKAL